MQDPYRQNLIHCTEHGFTLRKERHRFYVHEIYSTCVIQNFEVGYVVTHVNQYAVSKSTTLAEMVIYLQDFISIQVMTPNTSRNRFLRLGNIATNSVISRHGFTVMKHGEYLVVEDKLSTCAHSNVIVGYVLLSVNGYRILGTTTVERIRLLLNTEVLRHVVCRTIQYARSYQALETSTQKFYLEWNKPCLYGCGFIHLATAAGEEQKCCMGGRTSYDPEVFPYPALRPMTTTMAGIFRDSKHFSQHSSTYNNILALAATGVENNQGGGFCHDMHGPHAVKMNGRTYHFLKSATSSSTDPSCGLSYFIFDAQAALLAHKDSIPGAIAGEIDNEILLSIYQELSQINYLCQELHEIGNISQLEQTSPNVTAAINASMTYFEVAHITSDAVTGNRCLRIALKHRPGTTTVSLTDGLMEPLSYPIFFIRGEKGWDKVIAKDIGFMEYLAARLLQPEYLEDGSPFLVPSKNDPNKLLHVNRFQAAGRARQVYLVDMVSRAIDYRLSWHRNNQDTIFGGEPQMQYNGDLHVAEVVPEKDRSTFLPSSFHGGRRNLKMRASNALAIVSELEGPTLFITLTGNPNWPEVQSQMLPGQTAFDRDDIMCMSFKARLDNVLKNIRAGKYFGPHQVVYMIRVIEYQHRGLPHAHIVVKLKDLPTVAEDREAVIDWIDTNTSACMPPNNHGGSTEDEMRYRELVESFMVHNCNWTNANGCKASATCKCKRGYDDTIVREHTDFDDKGFPLYKRENESDLKIVPHNRKLLLDWEGHANVEYAGSAFCVLYLYKYLYKGHKKVKVSVTNEKDRNEDEDEISLYLRGRFLCAMDAMWRTLGYQTYPAPEPNVQTVKVKMPNVVRQILLEKKSCDMLIYFNRPLELREMKYTDVFKYYVTNETLPARFANRPDMEGVRDGFFKIAIQGLRLMYLCRRTDSSVIMRLEMLYVTAGDIWYLRLILLHKSPVSYNDARTVNGIQYDTFQQAAIALNLVNDLNDAILCFEQSIGLATPHELRCLFATLTINGFPTLGIWYHDGLKRELLRDWLESGRESFTLRQAENAFLQELKQRLITEDKTLDMYGFPSPAGNTSELDRERLLYDAAEQLQFYQQLSETTPNNLDQEHIFNTCMDSIELMRRKCIFIDGPGGTGKTTVIKKIIAKARAQGKIVKVCASTTLAATLYENATTAHSLFKYPVEDDNDKDSEEPTRCNLEGTDRLELLKETSVIIWDEFVSNNRTLFEAVQRDLVFHCPNLIFICAGDFRQILPVVKYGSEEDIIGACISSSTHWQYFRVLHLTTNMRLNAFPLEDAEIRRKQQSYAESILALGEGRDHPHAIVLDTLENGSYMKVGLPLVDYFLEDQLVEALTWLYPNGYIADEMIHKCILASTNEVVDKWNSIVQQLNPQELMYELNSHDYLCDVDDPHGYLARCLSETVLNSFNANGVPKHVLRLKVDDICIVTRALKASDLATNTRVKILSISSRVIRARTLDEHPRNVIIPRIRFKFKLDFGESYQMMRCQFPLRLAYCMTYNKSQSQTFHQVLLDATGEPFSHGHLYVAMSRIRLSWNLRVFISNRQLFPNLDDQSADMPVITNVVYQKVLLRNNR